MNKPFIAKSADIVGDVTLGLNTSVWFQVAIRGDMAPIVIGDDTNIQEGTVIHVDHGADVQIGRNVTIGHQCLIHGCHIGEGALIGMGSIIMNHSVIGENCLVGAGSLVTENKTFPPNTLIMGRPAKVVRELTPEEIEKNHENTRHYVEKSREFLAGKYGDHHKNR